MAKSYLIDLGMITMAENNKNNWFRYMAWGSVIAFSMAGLVGGGYLLGNILDTRLGTDPLLKIVLMITGVILGIIYLLFSVREFGNDDE